MRLFTAVWGRKHIDWFEHACVASLTLPANLAALRRNMTGWDIVTQSGDIPALLDIAGRIDVPVTFFADDFSRPHGEVLQSAIIGEMERCIAGNEAVFMAPPDTIFGDGSVAAIISVGEPHYACIAVPHVRVLPRILGIPAHAKSNAALVSAAFKSLHRTWVEADVSRETTNSFFGGCSWRSIGPGLYGVTHLLPTVYLAKFNETDLGWWQAQKKCDAWDHRWPSKLVAEARQRVIGSSDAAFMVELTEEFQNVPPVTRPDPDSPHIYWGQAAHNLFNANAICVFRAE